jgi:golgin subfamily B member 1
LLQRNQANHYLFGPMPDEWDKNLIAYVHTCVQELNDLKISSDNEASLVDQKGTNLLRSMSFAQNELESLKSEINKLSKEIRIKEEDNSVLSHNLSLLYKSCSSSIDEVEADFTSRHERDFHATPIINEDCIRSLVERLVSAIRSEARTRGLKSTIMELQRELQEKDFRVSQISSELSAQIRDGEEKIRELEKQVEAIENEKTALQLHVTQLQDVELSSNQLRERVSYYTDMLAKKEQGSWIQTYIFCLSYLTGCLHWVISLEKFKEPIKFLKTQLKQHKHLVISKQVKVYQMTLLIFSHFIFIEVESLMQALDEEEKEMEEMEIKNKQLQSLMQEREISLKSLEASNSKVLKKLSTTTAKFDELHQLSENLIEEVENLQLQLEGRDSEISFLRQEVTRVTNELLSSDETYKRNLAHLQDFAKWVQTLVLRFGLNFSESDELDYGKIKEYTEAFDSKLSSVVAELDELRVGMQSRDALLQIERGKIADLVRKCEGLESSLREQGIGASTSGVLEIEQMVSVFLKLLDSIMLLAV